MSDHEGFKSSRLDSYTDGLVVSGFKRFQARSDANRRITMSNRSSVGATRRILGAQVRVVLVEGPLNLRTALD